MEELSFKDDVLPLKDKLYRLALRITLSPAEAQDVVQDTLLKVWEKRHEAPSWNSVEAFSLTVCRHLAVDATRRAARRGPSVSPDEPHMQLHTMQTHEEQEAREKLELVKDIMNHLPPQQRAIMELRDMEGKSYQEIASVMNLSPEQVKVYLHRARTRVRQETEEIYGYGL